MRARCAGLVFAALLAGVVAPSCGRGGPPERTVLDLDSRADGIQVRSGVLDLTRGQTRELLLEGWHPSGANEDRQAGVWAAAPSSEAWIPAASEGATKLELELRVPAFLAEPCEVEAFLNGSSLGVKAIGHGSAMLGFDLQPGIVHPGLNLLRIDGPETVSPSEVGSGEDTRRLGLRLRRATLVGDIGLEGILHHIRTQGDSQLVTEVGEGGALIAQDPASGAVLALGRGPGRVTLDLRNLANREVMVLAWAKTSHLLLSSEWNQVNLVVIVCDTLRSDVIQLVDTPALDALAKESVVFGESFSHAPMTLPSHTALFSSRYPHVSGIVNNGQKVPPDLPLLAEWLQGFGYETRAVASLGTLWLGKPRTSLDRGFDTFQHVRGDDTIGEESVVLMSDVIDSLSGTRPFFLFDHFADPHEPYRDEHLPPLRGTVHLDGVEVGAFNPRDAPHVELDLDLAPGEHELVVACAEHDIKVRSLILTSGTGHGPRLEYELTEGGLFRSTRSVTARFHADEPGSVHLETFVGDVLDPRDARDRYMQEVARVDRAIGELIEALKESGNWDNSIVLFTSDHGEALRDHGMIGHVQTLYDELLHVPLMIRLPDGWEWDDLRATLEANRSQLVRHIDLVPTLLGALGLPGLPGQMGKPIGERMERTLVAETHAPEAKQDLYACRDEQFKLVFAPESGTFSMYDIQNDPGELEDVFAEHGSERERWTMLLQTIAEVWAGGEQAGVAEEERARLQAMGYF